MKNLITLLIVIFLFSFQGFSSITDQRDSLLQVYNTATEDTTRFEALCYYAMSYKWGNIDTAITLNLKAISEFEPFIPNQDSVIRNKLFQIQILAYSHLLLLYKHTDQMQKGVDLITQAKKALTNTGYFANKGNFYLNYSNILIEMGDVQNAYKNYMIARDNFEKSNDKKGMAGIYYSIGKMFFLQNDYERAIKNINISLKTLKESNSIRYSAYCFNLLASCYVSIAEKNLRPGTNNDSLYLIAIKNYNLALKIKDQFNDVMGKIITLNNLSDTYFILKDYDKSIELSSIALKLAEDIQNKKMQTLSNILFGKIYFEKGEIDKSYVYASKSYINSIKILDIEYQKHSSELLSKIYKSKNDYKNAYKYFKIYEQLKDSMVNKSHIQTLLENEQTNMYKRKIIEDSLKLNQQEKVFSLEIEQKKTWRNWLISIIASLVLLSFFIYRNFRNQSKARKKLSIQNNQIHEQNKDLEEQKDDLKDMNQSLQKAYKDKVDSIKYAKRIQAISFPTKKSIKSSLPNSFIIYKPLDIVSGDFYWIRQIEDEVVIAVGDSTGHGVPGAFLSIMGIAILKEMVNKREKLDAAEIMNDVRTRVIESLQHYKTENSEEHYGMDLGIVIYNKTKKTIQFSGANIPLYIVKDPDASSMENKVTQIKADKMPISIYPKMDAYTNHFYQLADNDTFFMFTDGTVDQFGGEDGKKIGSKIFSDYVSLTSTLPLDEQKEKLESFLSEWKLKVDKETGEHYLQTDDITILGVRV